MRWILYHRFYRSLRQCARATRDIYESIGVSMKLDTLIGVGHGDFNATLDGKRLEELAFDFILQPT